MTPLAVLHEDNHLLALNKPGGVATAHFEGDAETLDRLAKAYLKAKYGKPGNVFLGVVHRLDKPVSGVVLFARTSKAAARLSEQFREGAVEKIYWAVVEEAATPTDGRPWAFAQQGTLEDTLWHDDSEQRVKVVPANTPGSKSARLSYRTLAARAGRALLELRPHTGRKHQLRVQLAARGRPIVGDRKYGSPSPLPAGIALHARSLTVTHPITAAPLTLIAELPDWWHARFAPLPRDLA